MPLWKSSSFLGRSIIMNKKSQFTKIFFKAILDLKDSGTWDIMNGGKSRQMDQSYNLKDLILRLLGYKNGMEKALGYKKLAILFAVLGLGTFMSLFVAFLEFITKMYLKKQKSTITIHGRNSIDDRINEILDDMSIGETEQTFQRILQQRIKRFKTSDDSNNGQDSIENWPKISDF